MRTELTRGGRAVTAVVLVRWLALALAGAILASACSSAPEPSSAPPTGPQGVSASGGELRFGLASEPAGLSPVGPRWSTEQYQVARALYDPLVSYDENYAPKPLLAESVSPNDNFTAWTIKLRDGVRFHDDSPLDAETVRAQFESARQSAGLSASLALVSAVEAKDPRTVVVRMSVPWSAFLHVLASQVGFVASRSTTSSADPERPIGTGPFAFDAATKGERIHVKRSPSYWQKGQPVLDGVDFRIVPDPAVRLRGVRAGQLDVAEVHEPEVEAKAATLGGEKGPLQVLTDNSGETPELVIVLQSAKQPFVLPMARQAVAFGVDREAVSRRVFAGAYPQAYGPYSEGSPWYGQAPWPGWDAGKARQSAIDYQSEAGKPLRFTMLFPSDPLFASLGQLLVSEFEAAGIGMTLEILPPDEVKRRTELGDFEASVMPLFAGGHPDEDFGLLYGKGTSLTPNATTPNLARLKDPIIDEAIDKSRAAGDISKQSDQYQKVQEELAREAQYVFLIHLQGSIVAGKNVQALTKWTLPDGSLGISQLRTTVSLNDAWVTKSG